MTSRYSVEGEVEEGVRVKCFGFFANEKFLLVGSDNGIVLVYVDGGDGLPGGKTYYPVYRETMHYGPVYDLAVSASIQVVTGGHDGTCCVGDLAPLVRLADETAEVRWREKKRKLEHGDAALPWFTRFEHHTLPVVCVRCFSDGNSFLSLSVDGGIVVQQTTGDRPILLRTSCGFPSKCLTFSVDESYCIVGGTQCAAVDLNRNQRSDASFIPSDSEVRLLPFHLDDGDQLTHTLPANTFFSSLTIQYTNGEVRGVLTTAERETAGCVTWGSLTEAGMWGPAQGHHSEREAVQLAQPQEGLEPSPAEYPRWTSWAKSNVRISDEQREALLQRVPGPVKQPTVCPAEDAAAHLTPAQTLTLELKEKERLEGEVDLLAVQLKQLLSSRVAKSKNKQ